MLQSKTIVREASQKFQPAIEMLDRFLIGPAGDRCVARQPPVLDRRLRLAGFAEMVREKLRLLARDGGHVG